MKKKVFSLMVLILFVSGAMSAENKNLDPTNDCAAEAFELQKGMEEDGIPKSIANEFANEFYEFCIKRLTPQEHEQ